MNRLIIIIAIFIFSIPSSVYCQYYENKKNEKEPFKEKLFFGGGLGLQFGTYTLIDVSPIVGYKVTPKIQPGVRFTYQYQSNQTNNYSTYRYGGSAFLRLFPIESFFLQAEAEGLNIEWFTTTTEERLWIENYFVGAGYFQKLGKRSGTYFTVLWNLNESKYSPYTNPVIRIGFVF